MCLQYIIFPLASQHVWGCGTRQSEPQNGDSCEHQGGDQTRGTIHVRLLTTPIKQWDGTGLCLVFINEQDK